MPNRDALHQLVDELPETEIGRARHVLAALLEAAEVPDVNYLCAAATISQPGADDAARPSAARGRTNTRRSDAIRTKARRVTMANRTGRPDDSSASSHSRAAACRGLSRS